MKRGQAVAAAVAIMMLAGCGGDPSLADRDPEGAQACAALAKGLASSNTKIVIGQLLVAGEHASLAETATIEEAQEPLLGQNMAKSKELRQACVDEGVDMPPLKSEDAG